MPTPLHLSFDIGTILETHQELADKLEPALTDGVGRLATMAHSHITEEVRVKLQGSSKQYIFLENLELDDKESKDGTWYVTVLHPAVWIEDGLSSPFDMLPGFLNSAKAKQGPNGKYLVIPFKHNKDQHKQSPRQRVLAEAIKSELKKRGIPGKKIEKNPDGSPKLGLLHKFDLDSPKQKHQIGPPGQGPQGAPWQAHSRTQGQEGAGGRPYLWGVRVYQRELKDSNGANHVQKDIMTFRTASEKHKGNLWLHPGSDGMNFLDEARDWAEKEWNDVILVSILKDFGIENA